MQPLPRKGVTCIAAQAPLIFRFVLGTSTKHPEFNKVQRFEILVGKGAFRNPIINQALSEQQTTATRTWSIWDNLRSTVISHCAVESRLRLPSIIGLISLTFIRISTGPQLPGRPSSIAAVSLTKRRQQLHAGFHRTPEKTQKIVVSPSQNRVVLLTFPPITIAGPSRVRGCSTPWRDANDKR